MSEDQKVANQSALDEAKAKAAETNVSRTGKGTRVRVGQTRGRNPQVISWEAFDESLPATLPSSIDEFRKLSGADKLGDKEESTLLSYLIDGFNSASYTEASDPIAEYVEASWPEDIQKNFRSAVRTYVNAMQGTVSLDDAVAMIKPNIVKMLEGKK